MSGTHASSWRFRFCRSMNGATHPLVASHVHRCPLTPTIRVLDVGQAAKWNAAFTLKQHPQTKFVSTTGACNAVPYRIRDRALYCIDWRRRRYHHGSDPGVISPGSCANCCWNRSHILCCHQADSCAGADHSRQCRMAHTGVHAAGRCTRCHHRISVVEASGYGRFPKRGECATRRYFGGHCKLANLFLIQVDEAEFRPARSQPFTDLAHVSCRR